VLPMAIYIHAHSCSMPAFNFLLSMTAVLYVNSLFTNTVIELSHLFIVMATPSSLVAQSVPPGVTIRVCKCCIYSTSMYMYVRTFVLECISHMMLLLDSMNLSWVPILDSTYQSRKSCVSMVTR
jgi:hypothetical protein